MQDISRHLPHDFVAGLAQCHSPEFVDRLVSALSSTEPSLAVRANSRRGAVLACGGDKVPWLGEGAVYLDKRPNFALDPAWHQGLYYVQDASSMALTAAMRHIVATYFDNRPVRCLDACAAPGGKSIAAAEVLPVGSAMLSNEYDNRRAMVLAENIAKYGMANIAVSRGDTSVLGRLDEVFDIVIVDAPCSGEGMMRKEPVAIEQWSPELVRDCATLQRKILDNCWRCLRPGGVMVYSTCTFNCQEDESNLEYIVRELDGEPVALPLEAYEGVCPGVGTPYPCYHFYPGFVRGEGLFICSVRKPGGGPNRDFSPTRPPKSSEAEQFKNRVIESRCDYFLRQDRQGNYYAVAEPASGFFDYLASRLQLLSCGIPLATQKGKDLMPAWQLAFSEILSDSAFASINVGRADALRYLHGESLSEVPDGLPKGFVTVNYNHRPLGFVKNIGRRANNLYPDALRLRLDPAKGIDVDYQVIV